MNSRLTHFFCVVILTLGISKASLQSQIVWDGGASPDQNWSTGANWAGDSAPGSPYAGTVQFGANGFGMNVVDQDWTVNSLFYINDSLTESHVTDLNGKTLIVANGQLCVGYFSQNTVVTIQNGTLQLGTASTTADLYSNWPQGNPSPFTGVSLTINAAINAVNLRKLAVTKTDEIGWPGAGAGCDSTMDLSGASITSDGVVNKLKTSGSLSVAGYGTPSTGLLKMSTTVTNIEVGYLLLGCDAGSIGILDMGADSQLKSISISNSFIMGERGVGEIRNLPTNGLHFTVGSASAPARMVFGLGRASWAPNGGTAEGSLILTNGVFSAYLTDLVLGDRLSYETTLARGILNLTNSSLGTFNVAGDVHVGYSTTFRGNWDYLYSRGYLLLPAGTMNITNNLYIGDVKSSDEGLVELHGTMVTVGKALHILDYGDAKVWLNGTSAGFDLASSDTNDFTIAAGAKLDVVIQADPAPEARSYWCLRMMGDQTSYFSSLTNSGLVTLDMTALSATYQRQFAISYDGTYTIFGIPSFPRGTVFTVR